MDTEQKKQINEETAGEDLQFSGDDMPSTEEDGFETLMEDIEHAAFMQESGFSCEAEEDLRYIMEKLENGGYNVDDETARSQKAVIEDKLKLYGD